MSRKRKETPQEEDGLDYMSDDFLKQLESQASKEEETRYLTWGSNVKLKRKKEPEPQMKLADKMAKTREEGLSTPVAKSNIGHKLMTKMGYKEGMGLGPKKGGISTPVDINLKADRGGLGRDTLVKEAKKELENRKKSNEQVTREIFRSHQKFQLSERKVRSDLTKARVVIESLDTQVEIPEHNLWPPKQTQEELEEDETSEFEHRPLTVEEQEDKAHKLVRVNDDELETPRIVTNNESNGVSFAVVLGDLNKVLTYLREKHFYCYYCSIKFDGTEDMAKSCPGPTEQDHEE